MNDRYDTLNSMVTIKEYIALDGWELIEPLIRDHGVLYRATREGTTVQAATELELCRRIWDIECGIIGRPRAKLGTK
jgi:hypothetical protein